MASAAASAARARRAYGYAVDRDVPARSAQWRLLMTLWRGKTLALKGRS